MWSAGLGLLPVPLLEDPASADSRYVMLNGSQGNFILDLRGQRPDAESRSVAWSANVGHHIALINDQVEVQRWDAPVSNIERYSYRSIVDNLEQFHLHLERSAPRSDLSVVAHCLRLFRSLRASLGRDVGGPDALQAFLVLLASGTDGASRQMLDLNRWQITSTALDIALQVSEEIWATLSLELLSGRRVDGLKPNLDILLRHAAGVLFQEAHYEAVFADEEQLRFGVLAPDPVTIGKEKTGIGLHFTPAPLARSLVEECLAIYERPAEKVTIFDPACGSGEFLREARRQLRLNGYAGGIDLIGWDISPAACAMARFILARDTGATAHNVTFEIHNVDALSPTQEWPQGVDIIVTNPPFVSWQGMTPTLRERVTQILGSLAKQRPDFATAFLWHACSILGHGAVIGSILPASFLNSSSSAAVRGELSRTVRTRLVARLGSHVLFPGALVDAAFYVGIRNGTHATASLAVWADYRPTSTSGALRALRKLRLQGGNISPVVKDGFSIYEAPELGVGQVSWSPRPYDAWSLRQQLIRTGITTVADLFSVRQGSLTGRNKAFLLNKEQHESLPLREKGFFRPAVFNASVNEGRITDSFYVFFPYEKYTIKSATKLREILPVFYEKFLKPHELSLKNRAGISRDRWWELTRHRTWQVRPSPKLLSTYFGDRGSFAWDRNGQFVIVQGYGWLPKTQKRASAVTESLALSYLAVLNSEIFSKLLSAVSNNVAGGQWNLSPRFINLVPLPDLFAAEVNPNLLTALANVGRSIHERGLGALSHLELQKLHEAVTRAYGLSRAD
jgi:adenine-specific DNA-methyltransferase